MNYFISFFILFSITANAGTVSGKASYKGTAKPAAIQMKADPNCVKENGGKTVLDEAIVSSGGHLANVFVYVKDAVKGAPAAPADAVSFDQKGCHYVPHVLGIRTGQSLKIINSDSTSHNVHSMAKGSPSFNAAMPTKGMTMEKKFTKAEQMVKVKCDIHGWMVAHIGVMDHPYFAVTGNDGGFSIKDLPTGEYTLVAWHEKLGTKEEKIKVTDAGADKPLDFAF